MDHTVTSVLPTPRVFPIASATGPLMTSATSINAATSTQKTVMARFTGRSFHTGRPSLTS